MPDETMTLDEYKQKRRQLEDNLLELIEDFEKETGAHIDRVRLSAQEFFSDQQFSDGSTRTSTVRVEDSL